MENKKAIINVATGEVSYVDFTSEEISEQAIKQAKAEAQLAEAQVKATAKAALLEQLGITEEQAKLLLN